MSHTQNPKPPLGDKRILVVEDEAFLAMWIKEILMEAGAIVIGPAGSVDVALKLLDVALLKCGVDAAVVDYNLGETMSLPVVTRLATRGIPFLIQSAYHDVPQLEGVRLITKPYPPEDLVSALTSIV
jgi:DNA-binding response OmpR family regulator